MLSRRHFLAGLATAFGALVAACSEGSGTPTPRGSAAATASPPPSLSPSAGPSDLPSPESTEAALAALRRKIGRMLIVGFRGTTLTPSEPFMRAIAAGELGGVILFDRDQLTATAGRNIKDPSQLAALTGQLRSTALTGAVGAEFLIAVDQEGGRVARLNPGNGYPSSSSEADLGARNDLEYTTNAAMLTAVTLAGAGIDFNLAPVVDLNLNPTNPAIGALGRSYSADPVVVVAQASAVIEVQESAGIRTAIKHFPGEGSGTGNTDRGIVDVTKVWTDIELQPFQELITAGLPSAVMVGHIINGQFDPGRPAALSKPTVTGLLRGQLGWQGVVLSDDLQAAAITKAFGADEAIALALEAGIDLLLFANQQVYDADIVDHVIEAVLGLVASGRISEARLDESVARIERLFNPVE
ncbi:MAG: glycoside hydrolase family 3 N-terminal domain-containing protein [Chloroflexota bacterium]